MIWLVSDASRGLHQKPLLLFEFPFVAGVVPHLERQPDAQHGRGIDQHKRQRVGRGIGGIEDEKPVLGLKGVPQTGADELDSYAGKEQQHLERALSRADIPRKPG